MRRERDPRSTAQDRAVGLPLLEQARSAFLANDLSAFASSCDRWLRHAHGIARGDAVLLHGTAEPVELQVDDFALSWDHGGRTEQPLLWLYGLTLQPGGQAATLQWNRVRHDARIAKLARHSSALAALVPSKADLASVPGNVPARPRA